MNEREPQRLRCPRAIHQNRQILALGHSEAIGDRVVNVPSQQFSPRGSRSCRMFPAAPPNLLSPDDTVSTNLLGKKQPGMTYHYGCASLRVHAPCRRRARPTGQHIEAVMGIFWAPGSAPLVVTTAAAPCSLEHLLLLHIIEHPSRHRLEFRGSQATLATRKSCHGRGDGGATMSTNYVDALADAIRARQQVGGVREVKMPAF